MHKIEDILAALGVVGAPVAAAKTIEVAQKLDDDAKNHNVVTKTDEKTSDLAELSEIVKSLAVIVGTSVKSTEAVMAKIDGFQANMARIEEVLAKTLKAPETVIQQEPSDAQMQEIKKTQTAIDAAKAGMPRMALSPSGAPMRPRLAIPDTMIGGNQ